MLILRMAGETSCICILQGRKSRKFRTAVGRRKRRILFVSHLISHEEFNTYVYLNDHQRATGFHNG